MDPQDPIISRRSVSGDVAALQVYSLIPPILGDVSFIVRTTMSGDVAAPMIKHAIASVDPTFYVRPTLSGDTYLRNGLAPTRFAMALLTAFALTALALAAVGIYGVVAYSVSQRTQEIGVRVALGATPGTVVRLVLRDELRLAVAGSVIGAAVALAAMRVLRSMLYGVSATDPVTFVAVVLLITAIALVASYVPARRALRIDPAEALTRRTRGAELDDTLTDFAGRAAVISHRRRFLGESGLGGRRLKGMR